MGFDSMDVLCMDKTGTLTNEKKKTYSVCGSESCGKVTHRDVQTGDMYTLIWILPEDVNMFMHKTL